MTDKTPSWTPIQMALPALLEVASDATAQGKTTLAYGIRTYLDSLGITNTLIRLESMRLAGIVREHDIQIPSEEIAKSELYVAGVVGVLKPFTTKMKEAIEREEALIFDYAGGLGQHRAQFYISSSYDATLQKRGVRLALFVVTTARVDRMKEAAKILEMSEIHTTAMQPVLVLNAVDGSFNFPEGSESAKALSDLLTKNRGGRVVNMPKVGGLAWQHFSPLGMEMADILRADPLDLAKTLKSDEIVVQSCQTHLQVWIDRMHEEFARVLPFRPAGTHS